MIKALPLFVALAAGAAASPVAAQVSRPDCGRVLAEVNKEVNAREGRPASSREVAQAMGIETAWVLRCMEAYGRVPARRRRLNDADREAFERAIEEGRPVELSDDQRELRFEDEERLRTERQEIRERRKRLAQEKEIDESSDFAFPGSSDFAAPKPVH
jgi:hypothetical protein